MLKTSHETPESSFFFSMALKCKVIKTWIVTKLPYSSSLKSFHLIKASRKTYSNLTHCASWRQLISSSCSKFSKICLPWKQKQMSEWPSIWQGAVPRAQQKWTTLKRVECSVCQEKSAGGIPDLVLARRKNETSKCLSLSIEFPSSPWSSETIPWAMLLFFVLPNWHPPHTVRIPKPQALFSLGPSQLLQLKEKPCTAELK